MHGFITLSDATSYDNNKNMLNIMYVQYSDCPANTWLHLDIFDIECIYEVITAQVSKGYVLQDIRNWVIVRRIPTTQVL